MKRIVPVLIWICIVFTSSINAQTITNYTDSTSGLPDNFINGGVAIDQNNNKWFGTVAGITKFDDVNWTTYTVTDGLIDNYTNCIAVDNNNNIWVGTDLGVSKFDGVSWTNYSSADGLPTDAVYDIKCDAEGKIWLATFAGLAMFNGTSFTIYTTTDGLPSDLISIISTDSHDNKWIGTWSGGVSKYDGTSFTTFDTTQNVADLNVLAVAEDLAGNIWIGTYFGLSVLDPNNLWVEDYTDTDGLYNNFVKDIDVDSHGNVWIATFVDYLFDGGITKYDGTEWVTYSVAQGLVDVQVKKIAIDQQDNVWVTTGSGVSKISSTSGLKELKIPVTFRISPNPTSGYLHIETEEIACGVVEIFNSSMQKCGEYNIGEARNTATISVQNLANGIYFAKIGNSVSRFCIEK